jgi:NTE family protein
MFSNRDGSMGLKGKRIGLALGAGGARGLSHIGVLRVFEAEAIPIHVLVGTSIGALIGAAYAIGYGTPDIERQFQTFLESDLFLDSALRSIKEMQASRKMSLSQRFQAFFKNRYLIAQAIFRPGLLQTDDFQSMIDFFLPDVGVQDTRIPFRAVATDLVSGEPVVISRGPIRQAVMASCAVPGAVPPLEHEGMLLSDGGIIHMVPTDIARQEGAQFVVAVGVTHGLLPEDEMGSAVDIYVRSANIMSYHMEQKMLKAADVVIKPRSGPLHWTDFDLARELIREGERAAREKLPEIRKALPVTRRIRMWASYLKGALNHS